MTSKSSDCFICGKQFPLSELTAHEKTCLDNIKSNDVQYTRQNTDESSSTHSYPSTFDTSNLSTRSSSSGESDRKFSRCYICGTDVPNYLSSIHEKNCKKSWETGLLNSICTPARQSNSRGDIPRSLSRGSSRSDLRGDSYATGLQKSKSSGNLRDNSQRSKSSTNLADNSSTESKQNNVPRYLRSNNRRGSKEGTVKKSKSTTNLSNSNTTLDLKTSSNVSVVKSMQDVRQEKKSKKSDSGIPQYIECRICGKQYSVHSISIHQRQCERTYNQQKDMGINVEYKKKSKSLADLTSRSSSRPSSAMSSKKPTHTVTTPRPATANPINRIASGTPLSASTGNLGPTYKRNLLRRDIVTTEKTDIASNGDLNKSPGLQKCHLCGQLYGTRSLPIHEKQCLKKWERQKEEEEQTKKKEKRVQKDIQILKFGREKFSDESDTPSRDPVFTPSKLFGVPSPLRKQNARAKNTVTEKPPINEPKLADPAGNSSEINKENNANIENGNATTNETTADTATQGKPKFVVCIYCYKQYGLHSIAIHEKSCRERKSVEAECKERIVNNSKVSNMKQSKSVGDVTAKNGHINGTRLVTCDDCQRKFLSADIERHRLHCRVAIL